ncbi:MAG: glycosyltransferase [Tannerellaceae bacterium]|jgi:glycosyltransferase involved in cell wall biosynthesis|nr:glycosyltransferase [Tannerellaceae bacterium]
MKECEDIWMHITWTGRLNKSKLYSIYSIADIGILPSLAEQCSYVAIEMMMHGMPLIASTSTGLNEMIEEGYNGLHIPIEESLDEQNINTTLLAEKIIYLLQNPEERKRMGVNSRRRYETLYTSEIMGREMLNVYHSVLKKIR